MAKYIGKRLLASVITIFLVITVTFFLMQAMPGDPFISDKMTEQVRLNLQVKYGLDKPLSQQYLIYLKNIFHGDLGESINMKGRKVTDIIAYSFPTSAKLGIVSVITSVVLGTLLGIISALKQGKLADKVITLITTLGITIPSFVVSAALIYFLAVKWKLLPVTGLDGPKNYIMPVIALSGSSMAFITRLTRSKLIEVLKTDYVRTAQSKGLTKPYIILNHCLRNSSIPVVTYLGTLIASVLTGSFVVEKIFGIPGLGREFVNSVGNRDYNLLMGVTIFYCILIVFCNFMVDILYVIIDPRIKVDSGKN